ncbi:Gfo/Idh/MocA family protein [Dyadobacter bucti]|uniref:Gfo/Idh/MocA family protein n=1 Tax=Dyadobacter bucti TaxID=2572203 RepID=UPI00110828DE|nr:Gfo/Idh/MocA family oxidoreductase [Dyadobacter bucti]
MERRDFVKTSALIATGMLASGWAVARDHQAEEGKRVGIIGLDTSHSEVFTRLINGNRAASKGFKVVAAYTEGSRDIPSALEMKPGIIKAVKEMDVEIVGSITELLQKVDVVLLESNDGRIHLEQAVPVLKAGKRIFIDKPLAANLGEAREIFKMAAEFNTPVFSSSALRFEKNVQRVVQGAIGEVTGADVYAPAEIEPHHLDLAWYAIHGVEMLFTVMGPGCKSVSRVHCDGTDLVTGVWENGSIGTVRAIRKGTAGIAGTAFGTRGIAQLGPFETYEPLVEQIVSFFESGKPPVTADETLEIFRFMDAADRSRKKNGKAIHLS